MSASRNGRQPQGGSAVRGALVSRKLQAMRTRREGAPPVTERPPLPAVASTCLPRWPQPTGVACRLARGGRGRELDWKQCAFC